MEKSSQKRSYETASSHTPVVWPALCENVDPININPARLTPGSSTTQMYPYDSLLRPIELYVDGDFAKGQLRPEVVWHIYKCILVAEHYTSGTAVYYLPEKDVFFLSGDCGMNHIDGMVGPFQGDPRLILPEVASNTQ